MLTRSCALGLTLLMTACNLNSGSNQVKSDDTGKASNSEKINFFTDGFSVKIAGETAGKEADSIIVADAQGQTLSQQKLSTGLSLDQGRTREGDIIFTWPKASEKIDRDYDRLGALITEYGELVGTMLHRNPRGKGELAWSNYLRSKQGDAVESARMSALTKAQNVSPFEVRSVTNEWCSEVVSQFVNGLVPRGSEKRQYGNCGEGGQVGACLAIRSGFQEKEIRICQSNNDHFFAMVKRDQSWCVIDRWNIIDDANFACGADIDETAHQVTFNGEPVESEWFQRATCTTLDEYLTDMETFDERVSSL